MTSFPASPPHVSVVLSDRNWILERLGVELQRRLPRISLNDAPDPSADINYYITYSCRETAAPTLEAALFTHMETAAEAQEKFLKAAREVDLPICMSAVYADLLRDTGVDGVVTIPPGIDTDRFTPALRIGVVGRAYHTGRKGEGVVDQLMDMEGIDWHFTGSGWPRPGRFIAEADLPDFYRSMDYILVPALYEGGPMCVPEALAVGTPVIASDVGWVRDFPHIPFKTGDADDLRRVLTDLLQVKRDLAASTASVTWDNFAAGHERAFRDLMARTDRTARARPAPPPFASRVRLLTHGNEATTLGGPSVRVPRTALALRELGVPAQSHSFTPGAEIAEEMVHLFNVWAPGTALAAMRSLKASGKRVVLSPIFLELGERHFWHGALPALAADAPEAIPEAYAAARRLQQGRGRLAEAHRGYHAMVREMIELADHVILLSSAEGEALARIGAPLDSARTSLVRNPVDAEAWQAGDADLFRKTYLADLPGPADYVLCVGRIETRKNQLMLARAVQDLPVRLVLVGHEGDPDYAARIRQVAGDRVLMIGRLEHGGEMLRSAMAGARVFALPSWSEGASLAALEAAASGANMVLSDRSSETEYFGDLAEYCDPGDLASIRGAVEAALAHPDPAGRGAALQRLVGEQNSWARYALDTARAYATAARAPARRAPTIPSVPRAAPRLVLDITTLAHHRGRISGISRVEAELSQALRQRDMSTLFICWDDSTQRFIEVPARLARIGVAHRFLSANHHRFDLPTVDLPADATVVVAGSAWMQNPRYIRGLEDLKTRCGCSIISLIHDLVPLKFPAWFESGYAPVFRDHFFRLAEISDRILTDSRSGQEDVTQVLRSTGREVPPLGTLRLGDPALAEPAAPDPLRARFEGLPFVLAVGAIHTRKNYEMLYRVWARFADTGQNPALHLVIVGGTAWNGKPLADIIAADPRVNQRIHVLSDIDDRTLAWLYGACLFTVYPSHYEGWGLPVAESLVQGKLCLATSASSVPEIAPDLVEHIDPEDFPTWLSRIGFYAASSAARAAREARIRARYRRVDWAETAAQVQQVVAEPRRVRGPQRLMSGEIAEAGRAARPLMLGFGPGWHGAEGWGRWAAEDTAQLTMNVGGQRSVRVHLRLKTALPAARIAPLSIRTAAGQSLYHSHIRAASLPEDVIVTVPAEAVDETGLLTLELSLPTMLDKPNGHGHARRLGIGLVRVSLLDPEMTNPLHVVAHPDHWIDGAVPTAIDLSDPVHHDICAQAPARSPAWGVGAPLGTVDLLLPVIPGAPSQTLTLEYRGIATASDPVRLTVLCNGAPVGQDHIDSDAPRSWSIDLPAALLARAAPAVLRIVADPPLTPRDVGCGATDEIAGLGVFALSLAPTVTKDET